MEIITGYVGEPHVTSQQERNTNIGIFGSGVHIIGGVNSELEATVVSANLVEISDGMVVCEGCTAEVPRGTNDSLVIENGEQGMKRIDLIVARYSRNANTGAESMELVVIKGTSAASNPAVPSYNTGTIADGDSPVDFPLYRVNLDGISITSVDPLVDTIGIVYQDDFKTVVALARDNVAIPKDGYFEWQTANIPMTGYTPMGVVGTNIRDASQSGTGRTWCAFSTARVKNTQLDFLIRNHSSVNAARIRYEIDVLYQRVR